MERKERSEIITQKIRNRKKQKLLKKRRPGFGLPAPSSPAFSVTNAEINAIDSYDHDIAPGAAARSEDTDEEDFIRRIEEAMQNDVEKIQNGEDIEDL